MIFEDTIYMVYVDGLFAGIAEDESYIGDVANDFVNGVRQPLYDDDYADRVFWDTINVNRYVFDYKYYPIDKLSDKSFLCRTQDDCREAIKQLNELNLQKERAEAKIRALQL